MEKIDFEPIHFEPIKKSDGIDFQPSKSSGNPVKDLANSPDLNRILASAKTNNDTTWQDFKDAGLGALQGGSFGFADEIEGALRALGDKATGKEGNLSDNYSKHRDEARDAYKEAEARSPLAFTGGNLAGGVGTAVLSGGLGGLLGKAGAAGADALLTGQGFGNAVKLGAGTGALAGLGGSEANSVGGMAADTAAGGAIGGALGGTIDRVLHLGKGLKGGVAQELGDNDTVQEFAKSVKGGWNNDRMTGKQTRLDAGKDLKGTSNDIIGEIEQRLKGAGSEIAKAKSGNVSLDVKEPLLALRGEVEKLSEGFPDQAARKKELLEYIDKKLQGKEMSVKTSQPGGTKKVPAVLSSKDEMVDSGRRAIVSPESEPLGVGPSENSYRPLKQGGETTGYAPLKETDSPFSNLSESSYDSKANYSKPQRLSPGVPESLETLPNIEGEQIVRDGSTTMSSEDLSNLISDLRTRTPKGNKSLAGTNDGRIVTKAVKDLTALQTSNTPGLAQANSNYSNYKGALDLLKATGKLGDDPAIANGLRDVAKREGRMTDAGDNARELLRNVGEKLKKVDPAYAEDVVNRTQKMGDRFETIRKINAEGMGKYGLPTVKGQLLAAGNVAGRTAKFLADATPDMLKNFATQAVSLGGYGPQGAKILAQMAEKDNVGRNALLFSMSQQPEGRKFLKDMFGSEDDNLQNKK